MSDCIFELTTDTTNGRYKHQCSVCTQIVWSKYADTTKLHRNCGSPIPAGEYQEPPPQKPENDSGGPGTELKKLLRYIGIEASPSCSCNAHARQMDQRGPNWCETNVQIIVGWLKEEAKRRGLPFAEWPAKRLINLAIGLARRNAA